MGSRFRGSNSRNRQMTLAPNRRFAAVLADRGYQHCYHEHPSGHNWTTWEQGLERGLAWLVGW